MMILVRSGSKHHLRTSLSVSSSSEAAKTAGAAAVNTNGPSPPIQTSSNKNNQASVSPSSSGFSSIGNSSCSSGSGSPPGNSFLLPNFQGFEPEKLWSTSNYRFCTYIFGNSNFKVSFFLPQTSAFLIYHQSVKKCVVCSSFG